MKRSPLNASLTRRLHLRVLAAVVCSLALLLVSQAHGQTGGTGPASGQSSPALATPGVSAALEECLSSAAQAERSATFSGEMTATPGTVRMSMRVEVEERMAGEGSFHTITAAGLGVWRSSDPRVKVYKYLKQVSNLASPAVYRAIVDFRWLNFKGHVIKRAERLTPGCAQLAAPSTSETPNTTPLTPSGAS